MEKNIFIAGIHDFSKLIYSYSLGRETVRAYQPSPHCDPKGRPTVTSTNPWERPSQEFRYNNLREKNKLPLPLLCAGQKEKQIVVDKKITGLSRDREWELR